MDRARNCAWLDIPKEEWAEGASWDFDPTLRQCPKSLATDWACGVIEWWRDWKRFGTWPFPGGIGEQPAVVVEAVRIADDAATEAAGSREAESKAAFEQLLVQIGRGGKR